MRRFLGSRPALGRWAIGLLALALVATGLLLWSRWQEGLRWKLAAEMRRAFAARDVAAMERLYDWTEVDAATRARVRQVILQEFELPVAEVVPLRTPPPDLSALFDFRPNLPPVGVIRVIHDTPDRLSSEFLVGKAGFAEYRLVILVPVR
jgi:hypothetical protein